MQDLNQLISVPCPLCKSSNKKKFRTLNGHALSQCLQCKFQFADPRPREEVILKAYTQSSKNDAISFSECLPENTPIENYYSWTGVYVLKRLLKWGQGSFLDIGAGQGWGVKEALGLGFDAYGVEIGDGRAYQNDPALKDRIYSNEDELDRTNKKFDFLFLSAVFEHIWDPISFLKRWSKRLKPSGSFTIAALPNIDSLFIKLGLDSWDGNIPFLHLNYFSPQTLRGALVSHGFEITDLYTMGAPVSVSLQNAFKQKQFEGAFWGDNSRNWKYLKKFNNQPTNLRNNPLYQATTSVLNRALKLMGCGANIYVTFRNKEK